MSPGSPEAVAMGCLCPVADNCGGQGAYLQPAGQFWITWDCPIHRPPKRPIPIRVQNFFPEG